MLNIRSDEIIGKYIDLSQLDRFLDDAQQANRKFNLFSRGLSRGDLIVLIAESILPLELGWINENSGPIIDIGSGWGIPSIPILISSPELDVTFVERSEKKADFIALMLNRLGLQAQVYSLDLNELNNSSKFSVAIMRQVAIGNKLIKVVESKIARGAYLIYYGPSLPEDIFAGSESIAYSVDRLAPRKIFRAKFS